MSKKNIISICLMLIFSIFFTGCSKFDTLEVKFGLKNKDFEYIKEGKVNKILIQNKRDKGFKFIVTDKNTINEFYDILSSGKKIDNKSKLEPDYIMEFYEGSNKVHKFNYIAGIDKSNGGNFYDGKNIYSISKRLDRDIINNFFDIRKPRDFDIVYYESILKTLNKYKSSYGKNKTISIDIKEDVDVAKFVLSSDLEKFKEKLDSNITIYKDEKEAKDVNMKIDTYGYRTYVNKEKVHSVYKAIVTFIDSKDNKEKKYWIWDKYEDDEWTYNIYDKKPTNEIDGETF